MQRALKSNDRTLSHLKQLDEMIADAKEEGSKSGGGWLSAKEALKETLLLAESLMKKVEATM